MPLTQKEYSRRWKEKLKLNPEKWNEYHERLKAKKREARRLFKEKLKSDPVAYEAWNEKRRMQLRIRRGTDLNLPYKKPNDTPMSPEDRKKRRDDYNHRPDVALKRSEYYKNRRRNDPAYRAELNRKGVERFKAKKAEIYAYRKTRPDIYGIGAREYRRNYTRNKRKTDPMYILAMRSRARVRYALTQQFQRKRHRTEAMLGCTTLELKAHLESKFKPGMTWENISQWEIDHILPCASFDLSDVEQQRKCFHYTNLQPLWIAENRSKRDRIIVA